MWGVERRDLLTFAGKNDPKFKPVDGLWGGRKVGWYGMGRRVCGEVYVSSQ